MDEMRRLLIVGIPLLWLSPVWFAQAGPLPETAVQTGEDCAKVARRVYGPGEAAVAHLKKNNPQACAGPLAVGTKLKTPPLPKAPAVEPPRLSFVGPAVRTKTKGGWMEALPGQPVDKKMRIETSGQGGAEVTAGNNVKLHIPPNSKVVIKNLPQSGKAAEVQLEQGSLRADMDNQAKTGPLTVKTPGGDVKLQGDARIDADQNRAAVQVYEGQVAIRSKGTTVNLKAGQGTVILRGTGAQALHDLPGAPAWQGQKAEEDGNRPFMVLAMAGPLEPPPLGEVVVDFANVPGAVRYIVDVARDVGFNDRRAGGEISAPPLRVNLPTGKYYVRVSAVDGEKFVGPPSVPRSFYIINVRTDGKLYASNAPGQMGSLILRRTERLALDLSGAGQPLLAMLDGGEPLDCSSEQKLVLTEGPHKVHLQLGDAESELQIQVDPLVVPPPPVAGRMEGLPIPVSIPTLGLPGRTLQPQTQVYGLFSVGSTRRDSAFAVARLDLGGELAFLSRRMSFDVNVPLLYYKDVAPTSADSGVAFGDVSLGAKGVALQALGGRLILGPLLRFQLPTGNFPRDRNWSIPGSSGQQDKSRPVIIEPAIGVAALLGRFSLQTTQGLNAAVNMQPNHVRWIMSYLAEVQVSRLGFVGMLDASLGLAGGVPHGTSLGGGVRLHLDPFAILLGARGGLGDAGIDIYGRYNLFAGFQWAP
mgnify:CR=1 FL=1